MPVVNKDILVWARETAGLSPEEAARKLDIRATQRATATEKLAALELGHVAPTRPMLLRMAKHYRRPLLVFYMSGVPRKGNRGHDFRTLPPDQSAADEALVDALIRDVRARQSMVRAILEEEEEVTALDFVGSLRIEAGEAAVMECISRALRLDLAEYRNEASPDEAFALLRRRTESAGVYVLLIGNLGSHHTSLDTDVFRGFALADRVAPFVVINDQDSPSAWSFTLVHELAHLCIGETGISGGRVEGQVERFCNDVASEFLLPSSELVRVPLGAPQDLATDITTFARVRNVSSSMVAYRLYRSGRIDHETWQTLAQFYRDRWRKARDDRRKQAREQEGGPSYFVVRRHRLGRALMDVARRMVISGAMTTSKASRVLGVKPQYVQTLLGIGALDKPGKAA